MIQKTVFAAIAAAFLCTSCVYERCYGIEAAPRRVVVRRVIVEPWCPPPPCAEPVVIVNKVVVPAYPRHRYSR